MRTITILSDGWPLSTKLWDKATGEQLDDVVRIEFGDLSVEQRDFWTATLHFLQWDEKPFKKPEVVYIVTDQIG